MIVGKREIDGEKRPIPCDHVRLIVVGVHPGRRNVKEPDLGQRGHRPIDQEGDVGHGECC